MRALIAFPGREIELANALWEEIDRRARESGIPIDIEIVTTQTQARRVIAVRDFSVILIHEQLPRLAAEPGIASGGLDFIATLRANRVNTRAGLLHLKMSFTPAEVQQLTELKNLTLIPHSSEVISQLTDWTLSDSGPEARLDITLDLTRAPDSWKYRISGESYLPCPCEGFLRLRAHEVKLLRKLSEDLDKDSAQLGGEAAWKESLELLRENLWDRLVEGQGQFSTQLIGALQKIGPLANARLRFRTAPEHYGVAFEAIRHPSAPSSFWMVHAPVYRTLGFGGQADTEPLFHRGERRALNCLVILADASGTVEYMEQGLKRSYLPLHRAGLECEKVCALLEEQQKRKVNIGKIEPAGKDRPATLENLRALLNPDAVDPARRWDLVHFVGHTDFIGDRGYFILPGRSPGEPHAVPAEDLAPLMGNSRFLYLSSCNSASAAFVFRLAEYGMPTLLGFRARIPDSLAVEHATEFYGHLFRTRSIEDAFVATRRYFYNEKPESRVWARALVIMPK